MELHSIYNTAPIGLGVVDTNLRFLSINDRLAEINGVPARDHIGRTVGEVLPDLAEQAREMLDRILETGEALRDVEIRGETPSMPGVVRSFIEQFTPLRDESGKIVAISIVAEEVTEKRRLEEQVRLGEERLALALDAARLVMWEWRLDTDEVVFPRGDWFTRAEVAGTMTQFRSLVHPDDLDHMDKCIRDHLSGASPVYECEFRVRAQQDGPGFRWALSKGRITARSPSGKPLIMTGFRQDITAQREAAEHLAASERALQVYRDRLEIALEAGRMGVWEWSPGTDRAYWSPQVFELAGLPATEDGTASSEMFLELVDPHDRPALDAQLAKVLEGGGDYEAEFRVHPRGGRMRWLLSRGRVLHAQDGRSSRLVGINLDITQQKALEQNLRESDARRNEFLAMLGHELRNPLAPITNAVHLLERSGPLEPRQASGVQIIKRQAQHMARLVDDLLEVSRITQGRVELRMENLLVATAVHSAIETARPLARAKSQVLACDVPPDLDVVADPARLTQILSNLIVNAAKYTPAGGHIHVVARAPADRWVEIQVIDDGMGIPPELQSKVFDLFTQDRRTLERSEGGLGLGLALVKRLVELHGGHVECESAGIDRGSTFTVCLPRRGRREEPRGRDRASSVERIAPTGFLIVDDNRDAAETMAALLRLDGHRVSLAFDGLEALDAVAREAPDIVLLDIGLPHMNGLEVARRLRDMPRLQETVIIGMSGYAQAEDRAASHAAGFDAHLAKPAELADVYRTIGVVRA